MQASLPLPADVSPVTKLLAAFPHCHTLHVDVCNPQQQQLAAALLNSLAGRDPAAGSNSSSSDNSSRAGTAATAGAVGEWPWQQQQAAQEQQQQQHSQEQQQQQVREETQQQQRVPMPRVCLDAVPRSFYCKARQDCPCAPEGKKQGEEPRSKQQQQQQASQDKGVALDQGNASAFALPQKQTKHSHIFLTHLPPPPPPPAPPHADAPAALFGGLLTCLPKQLSPSALAAVSALQLDVFPDDPASWLLLRGLTCLRELLLPPFKPSLPHEHLPAVAQLTQLTALTASVQVCVGQTG